MHARAPRPLLEFAVRVAGPRDAAINLGLNLLIAWWICRRAEWIALSGGFSVAVMWGVMVWMVGACATFFGVLNGMVERKSGRAGAPLAADAPWLMFAILSAAVAAWSCLILFSLAFRLVLYAAAATTVPAWFAVVGQGVLAAVLGYCMQVVGVMLSRYLGDRAGRTDTTIMRRTDA